MVLICLGLQDLRLCSIPLPVFAFVTSFIVCLMLWLCWSSMGCLALRYCLGHCWIQQGILHFDSTLQTLTLLLLNTCFCKFYSFTLSFSNPGVLIYVGCDNRIPWTGWLINNRNYFLVLECGRSKIKTGRLSVSWGPASWFIDGCLLALSSLGGRGKGALWSLFYKNPNLSWELFALVT